MSVEVKAEVAANDENEVGNFEAKVTGLSYNAVEDDIWNLFEDAKL